MKREGSFNMRDRCMNGIHLKGKIVMIYLNFSVQNDFSVWFLLLFYMCDFILNKWCLIMVNKELQTKQTKRTQAGN